MKIDELIRKQFPNGVKYAPLEELADIKRGTQITNKTATPGSIPVIAGGLQPAYYVEKPNRGGYDNYRGIRGFLWLRRILEKTNLRL